ncbi:hypothetical protein D3C72_813950 [compost metagenome]
MPDIKPVDQSRRPFRDARGIVGRTKPVEAGHEIGAQAAGIKHQQAARFLRTLRLDIKGEPCRHGFGRELVALKGDMHDGAQPFARAGSACQRRHGIAPEVTQQAADGFQKKLLLAAEIMMRERCRHARFPGDIRHCHIQRTMVAYGAKRRIHKRLAAQRLHSDLGHRGLLDGGQNILD